MSTSTSGVVARRSILQAGSAFGDGDLEGQIAGEEYWIRSGGKADGLGDAAG
jgi:hypothetical protein